MTTFKKLVIAGLLSVSIALSGYVSLTPSHAAHSRHTKRAGRMTLVTDRRSKLIDTLS